MRVSAENMIARRRVGDKGAVDMLKKAGFTGIDYSLTMMNDWEETVNAPGALSYAEDLRRYAEDRDIPFVQSHAPFPFKHGMEMSMETKEFYEIVRSMEFAAHLGAPVIVVHSILTPDDSTFMDYNVVFYQKLLPFAEQFGIRIAVENLPVRSGPADSPVPRVLGTPEKFREIQDRLAHPLICGCLDIGHANLTVKDVPAFIRETKGYVQCLHVHDNDGSHDMHELPALYESDLFTLQWKEVLAALKETGFDGPFNMEILKYMNRFTTESLPTALKLAAMTACEMAQVLETD
ncbi:MAG: sugar phosphate isomerase/epimerase [Lachnospiraceae bacterium]|nr:sugar phosphate isomerase/epimerase [Lachnospiraceae bacterium]